MTSNQLITLTEQGKNAQTIRVGLNWDARTTDTIRKTYSAKAAHTTNFLTILMWPLGLAYQFIMFILAGVLWLVTVGQVNILPKNSLPLPDKPQDMLLDDDVISDKKRAKTNKKDDAEYEREDSHEYDIDLYCYARNKDDGTIVKVGPENKNLVSPNQTLFHSGENTTGHGVFDDETIHIKMQEAQDIYSEFFIVIHSDSQSDFASLDNAPKLRVIQSKEEKDITVKSVPIADTHAKGKHGFLYAKIYLNEGSWVLSPLNQFIDFDEKFEEKLKNY